MGPGSLGTGRYQQSNPSTPEEHIMIDYPTLKIIWWLLVGVLLVGFAIMDGHDMGVGTLLPFVGRSDDERRVVINTVGPHWDGNQVWFITGGGAIFAAWPLVYATAFSGFYWAMLAVLWALFFRPVGFDYRSKIHNATWRSTWDWGLFIGGFVPPLIFGVAFGNLLQGVPFGFDDYLISHLHRQLLATAQPLRAAGRRGEQRHDHDARRHVPGAPHRGRHPARAIAAAVGAPCVMVLALSAPACGCKASRAFASPRPSTPRPARPAGQDRGARSPTPGGQLRHLPAAVGCCRRWAWPAPLAPPLLLLARRTLSAFVASSLAIVGVIGTAGAAMFPFVMPSSTQPNASLTVWDSVSSHLTLGIMFWATLIFMPLIVIYTSWAYRVMRGKVTLALHPRERTHRVLNCPSVHATPPIT
jgi:cytochrome d ubiquinol oxidase subunit II